MSLSAFVVTIKWFLIRWRYFLNFYCLFFEINIYRWWCFTSKLQKNKGFVYTRYLFTNTNIVVLSRSFCKKKDITHSCFPIFDFFINTFFVDSSTMLLSNRLIFVNVRPQFLKIHWDAVEVVFGRNLWVIECFLVQFLSTVRRICWRALNTHTVAFLCQPKQVVLSVLVPYNPWTRMQALMAIEFCWRKFCFHLL